MSSDTATCYWVGINDSESNRIDTYNTAIDETTYRRSFTTPGRYCCYASAVNNCGYTESELVYFDVYDQKPTNAAISAGKTHIGINDTVDFTFDADQPCEFVLHIEKDGQEFDTVPASDNSLSYSFTDEGAYVVWVEASNPIGSCASDTVLINVLPDADAFTFLLPAALSAIEESAFEGSTAYVVYIPEGCTSIGSYAFKDCENLREIHIPTNCDISDTAFDGCGTIYVFGESGSSIENYCQSHNNCIFMEEE